MVLSSVQSWDTFCSEPHTQVWLRSILENVMRRQRRRWLDPVTSVPCGFSIVTGMQCSPAFYSVALWQVDKVAQVYSLRKVSCAFYSSKFVCYKKWFSDNKHGVWLFLPVLCTKKQLEHDEGIQNEEMSVQRFTSWSTVPFESGEWLTADSVERERQMRVSHEAITVR